MGKPPACNTCSRVTNYFGVDIVRCACLLPSVRATNASFILKPLCTSMRFKTGPLSSLADRPTDPECVTLMASSCSALPRSCGRSMQQGIQRSSAAASPAEYKQAEHPPHKGHTCRSSSALCAAPRAETRPLKCWKIHAWAATAGHQAKSPMVHVSLPRRRARRSGALATGRVMLGLFYPEPPVRP